MKEVKSHNLTKYGILFIVRSEDVICISIFDFGFACLVIMYCNIHERLNDLELLVTDTKDFFLAYCRCENGV